IDGQKIAGFDIPRTSISDGVMNVAFEGGKATITSMRLGKQGSTDDFFGSLTGDVRLNRRIDDSDLNLKARFGFSERYSQEKTISALNLFLGQFKTQDGAFAMALNGPIGRAMPTAAP